MPKSVRYDAEKKRLVDAETGSVLASGIRELISYFDVTEVNRAFGTKCSVYLK